MAAPDASREPLWQLALRCRCPRCGAGPLYDGMLTIRSRCLVCDLDLSDEDAGDGAAVFVILILGAIVVGLGVIVDHLFDPPLWVEGVIWVPVIVVGSILMLRPLKAALIIQQYRVRRAGD